MKKVHVRLALILVVAVVAADLVGTISFAAAAVTHGAISITFDDGGQDQYDYAFPLLQARGMKATFYIVTDYINTPDYMTVAELQYLQNYGCEIGSHSKTHPVFTTLTDSQIQYECATSKQVLQQSYGLTVNNFAYPYGGRDDHTDSIVAEYYRSARSAYAGPYIMQFPISQFVLPGFPGETGDSTALSKLESMVDQVYSTNGWAIIFFHHVLPGVSGDRTAISTQEFASFLDYIIARGVATVTVNQGLDLGSPPSVTISPTSVRMYVGQSQTFSSSVSGGIPPYAYQWYLNNAAVSGATDVSWTFAPAQAGFYNVYLNVTDSLNSKAQSNIVNDIQVYNQYPLTTSTNYGTVSPSSSQYNAGSTISISATAPVAATGERYVWLGWTGSGVGSYTGMNNPASITMNGAITETASWTHQYYLTVSSPYGTTSGQGWYNTGATAYAGLSTGTVSGGTGTQYAFSGWSGDASGTNYTQSSGITMNAPKTATANWKTQYFLTVSSAYGTAGGAGWYDSGASAYATVTPLAVAGAAGTQYVFTGWGSDASGTNSQSNPIVMSGAATATAIYKTQYYINVTSAHSDSAHGDPTPSAWVDAGTDFSVSVKSPADTVPYNHRFVCVGYSVDDGAPKTGTSYDLTDVDAPHTLVFNWKQQFWIVFKQEGLPKDLKANVTVDSVTHTLPYSDWFDQGATVKFTFDGQLPSGFGAQYVLSSTSNASPLNVESSYYVESNYIRQYTIEMYSVVAVPIVLVCLAAAIILLRRRRR